LAEKASTEHDPAKLVDLTRRINEILEENDAKARRQKRSSAA
jgi:hypothetical protein